MGIKDFDPILKRAAKAAQDGSGPARNRKGTVKAGRANIDYTKSFGAKIVLGNVNIRAKDDSSAAALGRSLNSAFGELADNFREFTDQLEGYLPADLASALEPTLELAKKYTPKDTGALVDSGYIAVEPFRGGARVEIGFAKGGTPDYAIFVHEMQDYKHAPPTGAKFLERAIDEDYIGIITRVTRNVLARTGD